ncbi:Hypothetical predicted protein [Octopus vulgaris]|uniref:Transmembrane protein n=1 Tax=Octopus vulgaris TaxID=6645 RepID=A0AA36ALP9_OCTVU|nr:Hypothetical predicted protein [Octopus vulgaris]
MNLPSRLVVASAVTDIPVSYDFNRDGNSSKLNKHYLTSFLVIVVGVVVVVFAVISVSGSGGCGDGGGGGGGGVTNFGFGYGTAINEFSSKLCSCKFDPIERHIVKVFYIML